MATFDRLFNSRKSNDELLDKIENLSQELSVANITIYHLTKEIKRLKGENRKVDDFEELMQKPVVQYYSHRHFR